MEWREFLYPIGFIAHIFFGLRMIIQWFVSEYQKRSVVPPIFWVFSLLGSSVLVLQGTIQIQFHVAVVHSLNCVLFWRNLNLLKAEEKHFAFRTVLKVMAIVFFSVCLVFLVQCTLMGTPYTWIRIPHVPWKQYAPAAVPFYWHLIGFLGLTFFGARFWVQWLIAERHKIMIVGPSFWWMSLGGAFCVVIYFGSIGDLVNLIGPLLGSLIYARNLMLYLKPASYEKQRP